jgi:hypothetical protein
MSDRGERVPKAASYSLGCVVGATSASSQIAAVTPEMRMARPAMREQPVRGPHQLVERHAPTSNELPRDVKARVVYARRS